MINTFNISSISFEIAVIEKRCKLNMKRNKETLSCIIECTSSEEAKTCGRDLEIFIKSGDGNSLNWYIGMDYDDVWEIFNKESMNYISYKFSLSLKEELNKLINEHTSKTRLVYVQGNKESMDIFDHLDNCKWIQFSLNESSDEDTKVSIWYE